MLLITPPAAGTKASTHFTQHSFSFPFYFSTNKNIVILNKQLGVSLISVFSLRWFGTAFFAALLAPELWLGRGWPESNPTPHARCQTLSLQQFVTLTYPWYGSSPAQLCAPFLQPPGASPHYPLLRIIPYHIIHSFELLSPCSLHWQLLLSLR